MNINKFNLIRKTYKQVMPDIILSTDYGIDPYFMDWIGIFTPIEKVAWDIIRYYGIPVYPQFPVLNYFIDFANPNYKIGIELDGKDFHDKDKDIIRDNKLCDSGWRIFRISGSEMMRQREVGTTEWRMNTGDGVLSAINIFYFKNEQYVYNNYMQDIYAALDKHRLIDFSIYKHRRAHE